MAGGLCSPVVGIRGPPLYRLKRVSQIMRWRSVPLLTMGVSMDSDIDQAANFTSAPVMPESLKVLRHRCANVNKCEHCVVRISVSVYVSASAECARCAGLCRFHPGGVGTGAGVAGGGWFGYDIPQQLPRDVWAVFPHMADRHNVRMLGLPG
jgi:hypothetical protein